MTEKTDELNKIIDQEQLKIAHFNEQGLSITPIINNCLFIYCNEYTGNLCFYTRALYLEDEDLNNSNLLLAMFRLSGPATSFPGYALGLDSRTNNLWISSHLPLMDARPDLFVSKVEEFSSKSMAFQAVIEKSLNKAKEEGARAGVNNLAPVNASASMNLGDNLSEHGIASAGKSNNANQDEVSSDELMQLMSSSNLIWG